MANEPHLEIQFIPGEHNVVADLLSKPAGGICVVAMKPGGGAQSRNDTEGRDANEDDTANDGYRGKMIWDEHCRGHFGPYKVYNMLRMEGKNITL